MRKAGIDVGRDIFLQVTIRHPTHENRNLTHAFENSSHSTDGVHSQDTIRQHLSPYWHPAASLGVGIAIAFGIESYEYGNDSDN